MLCKKVGTTENDGNSNFCFLCGSVFDGIAAAEGGQGAEMGNAIFQS